MKNTLLLSTGAVFLALTASAQVTNDFTTAEGFTAGSVIGQNSYDQSGTFTATVDPTGSGTVDITGFGNTERFFSNTGAAFTGTGDSFTITSDFSLTLDAAQYNADGSNISAANDILFWHGADSAAGGTAARVGFRKQNNATDLALDYFNSAGSGASGFSQIFFTQSSIGLNTTAGADLTSDNLRMTFVLTRNGNTVNNAGDGVDVMFSLYNIDTDTIVATRTFNDTASLSSTQTLSTAFFAGLQGNSTLGNGTITLDSFSAVPEPGTYALLAGLASLAFVALGQRQRKR